MGQVKLYILDEPSSYFTTHCGNSILYQKLVAAKLIIFPVTNRTLDRNPPSQCKACKVEVVVY